MNAQTTLIELEREITADPASVTLLLSGPCAGELWPDVLKVDSSPTELALQLMTPEGSEASAEVEMMRPVRSTTAYRIAFAVRADWLRPLAGTVALHHAQPVRGVPTTRVVLTFLYDGTRPEQLRELGERYLENVATAAESRSVE
jgi:hypothetical protein